MNAINKMEKIVSTVGKYNGDLKSGAVKYEKAKKGLEMIKQAQGNLEENLKKHAGFSEYHMPDQPFTDEIVKGDVTFTVKTNKVTQRPQYKTAVESMENYITSTKRLASNGHTISGVAKMNDKWYMSVDRLLGQFEVFIEEVKKPGLRQTIRYEDNSGATRPKTFNLENMTSQLNADNFDAYATLDGIKKGLENYVSQFEDVLLSKGDFVRISKNKAYKLQEEIRQGSDWGYVIKNLVKGDKEEDGELAILADSSISTTRKKQDLPFYDLQTRTVRGQNKLYVGLDSVFDRIQDLKEEKKINAVVSKYVMTK